MRRQKTCASMFSGGGGWDMGAIAAGYKMIWAIEWSHWIAQVYIENFGKHLIRDYVHQVDPHTLKRPDKLLVSPVCTRFSNANRGAGESEIDILAATTVALFLRVLSPPSFCLENVPAYARSKSMDIIRAALKDVYGYWDEGVFDAVDYGVPQSRRRFIVRANGSRPFDMIRAPRKIGWYEAIEDLLESLPASQFAKWQIERLSAIPEYSILVGQDSKMTTVCAGSLAQTVVGHRSKYMHAYLYPPNGENSSLLGPEPPAPTVTGAHTPQKYRALLVEGDAAGERAPRVLLPHEPAFTIKTAGGGRVHRAFIVEGSSSTGTYTMPVRVDDEPMFTVHGKNPTRAFLVDGKPANYKGDLCVKLSCEAVPTVTASQDKHPFRASLGPGRVVAMNTRALARFQTFPPSYRFSGDKALDSTIIGNAVPPVFAKAIIESVP